FMEPDFVVDVSDYFEQRMEAVKAFASQFYDPNSKEPKTFISSENFWHFLTARAREYGQKIGASFGEGFISERALKVYDPLNLL
ncbi:MAG: bacillithiol biosynthesis deacetylase BshB1, partial [Bacteroidota bacterium]